MGITSKVKEVVKRLSSRGHEIPDPTPVVLPVGFKHPPTIQQMVQAAIRTQFDTYAREKGEETWEQANDFDTGEDEDMRSPYELSDEVGVPVVAELTPQQIAEKEKLGRWRKFIEENPAGPPTVPAKADVAPKPADTKISAV